MAGSSGGLSDMAPYYDNADFSDVTIKFGGKEIKAHRMVLCAKSEYFKKALGPSSPFKVYSKISRPWAIGLWLKQYQESKEGVLELHDDDPQALERMLRYLYRAKYPKGSAGHEWEPHMNLVVVADKYAVAQLKTTAFDRVKKIVKSTPKTTLDVPRLLGMLSQYNIGTSDFYGSLEQAIFVQFREIWSDEAVQQYLDGKAALRDELFGNIFQDILDQPEFEDMIKGDGEMALGILRMVQKKCFQSEYQAANSRKRLRESSEVKQVHNQK